VLVRAPALVFDEILGFVHLPDVVIQGADVHQKPVGADCIRGGLGDVGDLQRVVVRARGLLLELAEQWLLRVAHLREGETGGDLEDPLECRQDAEHEEACRHRRGRRPERGCGDTAETGEVGKADHCGQSHRQGQHARSRQRSLDESGAMAHFAQLHGHRCGAAEQGDEGAGAEIEKQTGEQAVERRHEDRQSTVVGEGQDHRDHERGTGRHEDQCPRRFDCNCQGRRGEAEHQRIDRGEAKRSSADLRIEGQEIRAEQAEDEPAESDDADDDNGPMQGRHRAQVLLTLLDRPAHLTFIEDVAAQVDHVPALGFAHDRGHRGRFRLGPPGGLGLVEEDRGLHALEERRHEDLGEIDVAHAGVLGEANEPVGNAPHWLVDCDALACDRESGCGVLGARGSRQDHLLPLGQQKELAVLGIEQRITQEFIAEEAVHPAPPLFVSRDRCIRGKLLELAHASFGQGELLHQFLIDAVEADLLEDRLGQTLESSAQATEVGLVRAVDSRGAAASFVAAAAGGLVVDDDVRRPDEAGLGGDLPDRDLGGGGRPDGEDRTDDRGNDPDHHAVGGFGAAQQGRQPDHGARHRPAEAFTPLDACSASVLAESKHANFRGGCL